MQITKLGTAIPHVEMTLSRLSRNFPRFKAAIHPSGMPTHNATSTEIPPTLAETGNFIMIIDITVRPLCFRLSPKSPCSASDKYVTYRSINGLSRPYFASSAACACGLIAFSERNGPPGTIFIRKKVSVPTAQIVTIASNIRFAIYFTILKSPF